MKNIYYLLFLLFCSCNQFDEARFYEKAAVVVQKGMNKQEQVSKKLLFTIRHNVIDAGIKPADMDVYRSAETFSYTFDSIINGGNGENYLDSIYVHHKYSRETLGVIREDIQVIQKSNIPESFKPILTNNMLAGLKKQIVFDYCCQTGVCSWNFTTIKPKLFLQADTIQEGDSLKGTVILQMGNVRPNIITKVVVNGQTLISTDGPNTLNPKRFVFPGPKNVMYDMNGEYVEHWKGVVSYIDAETYEEKSLPIEGHYIIEKP